MSFPTDNGMGYLPQDRNKVMLRELVYKESIWYTPSP